MQCSAIRVQINISKHHKIKVRVKLVFGARRNIYISRVCYDVSVRLSVCDGSALVVVVVVERRFI